MKTALAFLAIIVLIINPLPLHSQHMEQRITLITLGVQDLSSMTEFYEEKFGWKRAEGSGEDIVFFELGGLQLSLYSRGKLAEDAGIDPGVKDGFKGFTFSYNTRSKEEVDRLFRNFRELGVTIIKSPEKTFWGGYSGYISDPEGNYWEIAFNPYLIPE